jgi:hypothetical protein
MNTMLLKTGLFFLLFISVINEATAMSIFGKNVMFSEVSGTVTLNNVPVKHAEIERYYRWSWDDKKETDKTVTDEKGLFKLPLREKSGGVSSIIPHEPVVFQQITIKYNGNEYIAWQHTKHNYDKNGELKGKSLVLVCELSKKPEVNDDYAGICIVQ